MKITKIQLRKIIREEIQKLNEKSYSDLMGDTTDINVSRQKLTSLKGAPKTVDGNFLCNNNKLTSLKGGPKTVGGNFWCHENKLTSLKGAPNDVGGDLKCTYNNLKSLEGAPKRVYGNFYCHNNSTKFTEEDVRSVCRVLSKIYV